MTNPLNERENNQNSTNGCGFVFAAAQMMIRMKTIEYTNDTELLNSELCTVNLTFERNIDNRARMRVKFDWCNVWIILALAWILDQLMNLQLGRLYAGWWR